MVHAQRHALAKITTEETEQTVPHTCAHSTGDGRFRPVTSFEKLGVRSDTKQIKKCFVLVDELEN